MFERHEPTQAVEIQDIEIAFYDVLQASESDGPQRVRDGKAEVQVEMSVGPLKVVRVNSLKTWYNSQGTVQEMRLLASYLDNVRSEANVRILPEGVGQRVPGEAQWVRTVTLLEKIAETAVRLGYTEAQIFTALMNYMDSQ